MPLGETLPVFIEDEMKRSYLDYAMSVIVSRALPDVRDGLKPVHRRILFSMKENDNTADRGYRKSARITGDIMGKYHPHGDCLHGDTLVPLLNGQTVPIKSLVGHGVHWVLALDETTGSLVPTRAHSWRVGQKTKAQYNIELSNGEVLKVTQNHPFHTKRGYVKAKHLNAGDLLTAGALRGAQDEYLELLFSSKAIPLHQYIGNMYQGQPEPDEEFHHKDHNKQNNRPHNLELVSRDQHALLHLDNSSIKELAAGRVTMFSSASPMRRAIREKNSRLLKAHNKALPIIKAFKAVKIMKERGWDITEENYEKIRSEGLIYNLTYLFMLASYGYSLERIAAEDIYKINTDASRGLTVPFRKKRTGKKKVEKQEVGLLHVAISNVLNYMVTNSISMSWGEYIKSAKIVAGSNRSTALYTNKNRLCNHFNITDFNDLVERILPYRILFVKSVKRVNLPKYESFYDFTVDTDHNMIVMSPDSAGKRVRAFCVVHNSAIYDAMVRLAQPFSMRMPLVQGQGNFGSMDGDPAAASRYTEARLAKLANTLLDDLEYQTVDYQPNYDETENEPKVLPVGYPNLLVNGAQGIAVGMATNIPTHNLGEVINACCAYIDDNDITIDGLMQHVPAPDFPTGGIILGRTGSQNAYRSGKGAIVLRAKHIVEERERGRKSIVFTEIPYQINKAKLVERIAECAHKKVSAEKDATTLVQGIAEIRDESDRDGLRIVLDLKRDAEPAVVLNQLYHHTPLQINFNANMLALHEGKPQLLTLLDIIRAFVNFRHEVVARRTVYLLKQARDRVHVLIGLLVAINNLDAIVKLIRSSKNAAAARAALLNRDWAFTDIKLLVSIGDDNAANYKLSEIQARAILDLRLARLTGLEQDKLNSEVAGLVDDIASYLEILTKPARLTEVVRTELVEIKKTFDTPRKSIIEDDEFEGEEEDLIPNEDQVIMISNNGYIKRVPVDAYRSQRRGGKGRSSINLADEDFIREVITATTHTPILFFTSLGKAYQLKCHRLPAGSPTTRGRNLMNMLSLGEGEKVTTIMPMPEDKDTWEDYTIFFATKKGNVRRNKLTDFADVRANGKIAMKFEGDDEDDELVNVVYCTDETDILLSTSLGKSIRFPSTTARLFVGRASTGQRGITLERRDHVISMAVLPHDGVEPDIRLAFLSLRRERLEIPKNEPQLTPEAIAALTERERFVLTVTEKGFGVRCSIYDYRTTARGGPGLDNMDMSKRKDRVVAAFPVAPNDEIMLVTNAGQVIRCPLDEIRIARRRTQGVTIIDIKSGEKVVSVAKLESEE